VHGSKFLNVSITFFTIVASYAQSPSRALRWVHHPALSWSDFKGRAPRNTGEPSAETDTGFRVQLECLQNALDIRVEAEFYTGTSWVKQARKSAELLRHEQGHFDITELYARKMRRTVRDANIGCADDRKAESAGRRIFDQLDREWEKAEKQYDADTKDGTDLTRQKEESERIANTLAALNRDRL
jgi:hypothetical protein